MSVAVFVSVKTVRKTVTFHYENLTDLWYVICERWRFLSVVTSGTCSHRCVLTGTGKVEHHLQEDGQQKLAMSPLTLRLPD